MQIQMLSPKFAKRLANLMMPSVILSVQSEKFLMFERVLLNGRNRPRADGPWHGMHLY